MPTYRITVVNREFTAHEERELQDEAAAREEGIRGAIAIGADQICDGEPMFGAEVTIDTVGGRRQRYVVTAGASRLNDEGAGP